MCFVHIFDLGKFLLVYMLPVLCRFGRNSLNLVKILSNLRPWQLAFHSGDRPRLGMSMFGFSLVWVCAAFDFHVFQSIRNLLWVSSREQSELLAHEKRREIAHFAHLLTWKLVNSREIAHFAHLLTWKLVNSREIAHFAHLLTWKLVVLREIAHYKKPCSPKLLTFWFDAARGSHAPGQLCHSRFEMRLIVHWKCMHSLP